MPSDAVAWDDPPAVEAEDEEEEDEEEEKEDEASGTLRDHVRSVSISRGAQKRAVGDDAAMNGRIVEMATSVHASMRSITL